MAKGFGLTGGIIGLIGAIMMIAAVALAASYWGIGSLIPTAAWGIGIGLLVLAVVAIVGASYSNSKPVVATILMLGAAIGGAAVIQSWIALLPGILLALGALFAYKNREEAST